MKDTLDNTYPQTIQFLSRGHVVKRVLMNWRRGWGSANRSAIERHFRLARLGIFSTRLNVYPEFFFWRKPVAAVLNLPLSRNAGGGGGGAEL